MTQLEIKRPEALKAGARSILYAFLACAFRYPEDESWAHLYSLAQGAMAHLPYTVQFPSLYPPRAEDYVHAFEVGGHYGAPCFIYEGEYGGGRLKVMEDALRFYDWFQLEPVQEDGKRERPDFLATELEFMHFLTFQEASALEANGDPRPYRLAQREFLRFHLMEFVQALASHLAGMNVPFYSAVASLARDTCSQDLRYLDNLLGVAR